MAGMAHIDAEQIRARLMQLFDHRLIGRGRAEGGENLGAALHESSLNYDHSRAC